MTPKELHKEVTELVQESCTSARTYPAIPMCLNMPKLRIRMIRADTARVVCSELHRPRVAATRNGRTTPHSGGTPVQCTLSTSESLATSVEFLQRFGNNFVTVMKEGDAFCSSMNDLLGRYTRAGT